MKISFLSSFDDLLLFWLETLISLFNEFLELFSVIFLLFVNCLAILFNFNSVGICLNIFVRILNTKQQKNIEILTRLNDTATRPKYNQILFVNSLKVEFLIIL